MKPEAAIIFALAAALCFHRSSTGPACGPSGCLLLPPDFSQSFPALPSTTALPQNEGARDLRAASR